MRIFVLIFLSFGLVGCATVNFSSKYYQLPENYKEDIETILRSVILPIKSSRPWYICVDECDKSASGIPYTDKTTAIYLPKTFLQYVYEFYYNDRRTIILCTFLHEIAHTEFNLPSKPPDQHYLTDKATIENLFYSPINSISTAFFTPSDMYSSLLVMQDYWRARKGLGGHLFNIGWNVLNLATLAYAGSGTFVDWFATDIATRINLLRRDYPNVKFIFKRIK